MAGAFPVKRRFVGGGGEGREEGGEFEDFEVRGMGGPVVAPADDDVAAGEGVTVIAIVAALEFKFEVDALPALRSDLAFGFAIGKAGLDGFDNVAEFFGHEGEEKDDALLVDGFMAEATEVHGLPVGGAAKQGAVTSLAGWRRAG
jgi:hypothetical protein